MNYLAHIFLAYPNDGLITGSFIADGFKGNSHHALPSAIKNGIILHRAIDSFTDAHPVIREMVKRLNPKLGKYTPVAVDIFGDYYLAIYFNTYTSLKLSVFEQYAYIHLKEHLINIPGRYRRMVHAIGYKKMLQQYAEINSLNYVFGRLERRLKPPHTLKSAVDVLIEEQNFIRMQFDTFFPQLMTHSEQIKHSLIHPQPQIF